MDSEFRIQNSERKRPAPKTGGPRRSAECHAAFGAKAGQAMVEFIVALIAVLALFAGLIQLASLTMARTDAMVEARHNAANNAVEDLDSSMDVLYDSQHIADWEVGPDGRKHSRDDVPTEVGSSAEFNLKIVDRAAPPGSWSELDRIPANRMSRLHSSVNPVSFFGLVQGEGERPVTLMPVVQSLLYDSTNINVRGEVWMTWTKGIY